MPNTNVTGAVSKATSRSKARKGKPAWQLRAEQEFALDVEADTMSDVEILAECAELEMITGRSLKIETHGEVGEGWKFGTYETPVRGDETHERYHVLRSSPYTHDILTESDKEVAIWLEYDENAPTHEAPHS
ncbi:MAG: hypothetical protein JRC86_00615, partial [Deltaproteobacteria bacterium]|nr:hypothetical protein [Deltaproteobacteria bacterium]